METPGVSKPGGAKRRARPEGTPGFRETVATFTTAYARAYDGAKPTWGAKQGAMMKALLKQHGAEEVQRRIAVLFDRGLDWPRPPYTLAVLVAQFDRLVGTAPAANARGGVRPSDVLGRPGKP